MLNRTAIFTHRVGDHMGPPPLTADPGDPSREVVARLAEEGASVVLVVDAGRRVAGIVTEQDVCRRIACRDEADAPIEAVMSAPVVTIGENDYLYRAIARMRGSGLRHMPVVNDGGEVVGVLELHRAMAVSAGGTMAQIERLGHDGDLAGMKAAKEAQAEVAEELCDDALPGPEVQSLLSHMNNDLYRGVLRMCLARMRERDLGEPPVAFDVVVMGSGGRGESFLSPDQDNGFVIEDYPVDAHDRIDGWFIDLAGRMTDALAEVGFAYCNGHVMATNPVWRKTLSEWRRQTRGWMGRGRGLWLRYCDIFFDFRSVYGHGHLAGALRRHVTALASHPFFLRELFKVDEEHGVALGLFDHLKPDPLPGPNKGKINLKLTGLLPLVGAVRIMALRERIEATGTLDRLSGLHERGVLDDDEIDYLAGAYRHISALMLRQQLADRRAGLAPGNHVPPDALSEREKDMLVDAFKAIRGLRSRLRQELAVIF